MSVTINDGAPSAPQTAEFRTVFGLGNVDNTSDANKPVSTAQQTALDLKLNAALVTAAALTVLDDATVAAMVNTLGGASSSGTGGLARLNGATFVAPVLGTPASVNLANATFPSSIATLTGSQTLTNKTITAPIVDGVATYSGASNFSETSLGDFVAHIAAGAQLTSTMTAAAELTFDSVPSDGRVFGPVRVPADSGGPYTLTIPSSVNVTTGATITTVSVPASGQVELTFRRIGSTNYVYGVPASAGATTALADITDMSADARTFNAAASYAAMRTAIGLVIGTNVQAFSSVLGTLAGASANGQSLVTAANYSAMRTLLNVADGATANTGTVTSVAMSVPTGLSIAGTPITASGTLALTLTAGYVIPTQATLDAKQGLAKVVGTALGTTGTVNLDLAALTGTEQDITATGNLTFTTSNRVAGRWLELRIDAGGSTRTLAWPAGWVAFGAALPTSLASGKVLTVAIRCRSTTDASIDATTALSV